MGANAPSKAAPSKAAGVAVDKGNLSASNRPRALLRDCFLALSLQKTSTGPHQYPLLHRSASTQLTRHEVSCESMKQKLLFPHLLASVNIGREKPILLPNLACCEKQRMCRLPSKVSWLAQGRTSVACSLTEIVVCRRLQRAAILSL